MRKAIKDALVFFQLASGHANIDTYLKRIGGKESDRCWYCDQARQTREHLFGGCNKWRVESRSLIREVDQKVKKMKVRDGRPSIFLRQKG
jgi:hypothetical protein